MSSSLALFFPLLLLYLLMSTYSPIFKLVNRNSIIRVISVMSHKLWLIPFEWQLNIKRMGAVFTNKSGSNSCRTRGSCRSENISSQTEVQPKSLPSGTKLLRRTLLIFSTSLVITWSPLVLTYVVRSEKYSVSEEFCDFLHRVALTMPFLRILSRLWSLDGLINAEYSYSLDTWPVRL